MRRTRVVGRGGAKSRARARGRASRPRRHGASRAARRRPERLPPHPALEPARTLGATASEHGAGALLDDPDVLERVAEAMQANGYAGDLMPAKLAYVALTSRLLKRPMNMAFVAEAATGKNATVDAARALVPPEAVYVFTAGSPRALLYTEEDFRHRVVLFTDADGIPQNTAAAAAVRALAEGNALRYEVPTLNRHTAQFTTRTITKPGPTGLITTSTRPLRPPLTTRLLQVPVAGDADATREVILRQGKEAAGETAPRPDLGPFLAFQRWLVSHPEFAAANLSTRFIEEHFDPTSIEPRGEAIEVAVLAAALHAGEERLRVALPESNGGERSAWKWGDRRRRAGRIAR